MSSLDLFLQHTNSFLTDAKKRVYLEKMSMAPMPDAPVFSLIPQDQSYISDIVRWKVRFGTQDGISFGSIQESGDQEVREAQVAMTQMFQRIKLDRFSMKITEDPKASAINFLKDGLRDAAKERRLTIEGSLLVGEELGTVSSVVDNGSGSFTITVTSATWAYGHYRVRGMLNFGSSTHLFRITDIDESNSKFTCQRDSNYSYVPLAADKIYKQTGKSNQPATNIKDIIEGTGTLHGIARRNGWRSTCFDLSSAPISESILLELMMETYERCQEYPDLLIVSPKQMIRILNMARDSSLATRSAWVDRKDSSGDKKSFEIPNVTYLSIAGQPVKLVAHPHMAAGSGYFINTDHVQIGSVGAGQFMPAVPGGGSDLLYMGAITGKDQYEIVWAYDWTIKCDNPIYMSGYKSAASATEKGVY